MKNHIILLLAVLFVAMGCNRSAGDQTAEGTDGLQAQFITFSEGFAQASLPVSYDSLALRAFQADVQTLTRIDTGSPFLPDSFFRAGCEGAPLYEAYAYQSFDLGDSFKGLSFYVRPNPECGVDSYSDGILLVRYDSTGQVSSYYQVASLNVQWEHTGYVASTLDADGILTTEHVTIIQDYEAGTSDTNRVVVENRL